jgi:hypothetical protein
MIVIRKLEKIVLMKRSVFLYHVSVMTGCAAITGVFTDFLVNVPLSTSLPRGERFL